MQDQLPAHAVLAIQKSLHFNLTALAHLRNSGRQVSRGFCRHVEFQCSPVSGLGLFRGMGQREINNRQSGGCVAHWINRGQSCTQPDRIPVH